MSTSSLPETGHKKRGKVLGVDLGTVRIGLALSDSGRSVAFPFGVLTRSANRSRDHEAIARVIEDNNVAEVVVGLPLSLSGEHGPAAVAASAEIEQLRARLLVPVTARDERLTTVAATRLRQVGHKGASRPSTRRSSPRSKAPVDDGAAAVLLQGFLDEARR